MINKYFLILAVIIFLGSCVSNKKVVYLQDHIDKRDLVVDSVLKSYDIKNFEYTLQAKDILSIKVSSLTPDEYNFFKETERELGDPLLSGYLIDEEGKIEIPAVGELHLEGLTIKEAEDKLKSALQNFLQNPVVRVKLLNFRITILGEVARPGTISSFNSKMSIMEAIASAGDLTELADRSRIKLIRYDGDQAKAIYLNTLNDNLLTSPYFYLKPNDLIIVAPLEIKNITTISLPLFTLLLSTLSAITFIIIRLSN